ncbi:MAG: DUF2240 family protein [Candidatus Aenigmarchaeota archaeon]|nr:DUF2240 family protein [Candidatus Aenigmarchaeota archaeon]
MALSDEILNEIAHKSGLSKEVLLTKINEKANEFSGLIKKEGAAYILAKELGIQMEKTSNQLRMKDLNPNSGKVNVVGRVIKITPMKEFVKNNGTKGKVANIYLGDGTGYVKLTLWDDQVSLVEDGLVSVNNILQVANAMSKENPFGELEITLSKFGSISLADEIYNFPSSDELLDRYFSLSTKRASIKDIAQGSVEITGNVVQVFKSKFLFSNEEDEYLIISCVLDDGTGDIRAVFFRELAEEISELKAEDLKDVEIGNRYQLVAKSLLGKEVVVQGRVVKNKVFDRFELVASKVKSLNVLEESRRLVDLIETTVGD